jgi:hypothetical protein
MEQALELVSALRLDTEFVPGGVKHRRHIPKPKPRQLSEQSKKRKRPSKIKSQIGLDSHMQNEEEIFVQVEGESHNPVEAESAIQIEPSPIQIDEDSATQVVESSVSEETILIEIEELWDIEPSSVIGQGAFGIVRFERRRPQMVNHTQTPHNQVRAVKEIRKTNTPDYMKELQAIAKFSQAEVCCSLLLLYEH